MRAVVLSSYGGPEHLEIRDIPAPTPGPDEVLVEVVATALNRGDVMQRQGLYPGPPMDHEVPGLEFAGRVVGRGSRVTSVQLGDEVMGIVGGGGYAEQVVTHERLLVPIPFGVSLHDAAAIPEVFITAFDALVVQGGLTAGRTALVHAGASGVGTAAIQIAKAIGARIIVTTSTNKVERCRELGADFVIDYTETDFAKATKEFTGGAGVDVIVDVVGGNYLTRNVAAAAPQGRIVVLGIMGGGPSEVNLALVLVKRISIIGSTLRNRPIEEKITVCRRFATEMLPFFANGTMHPVIDSRYAFDDIADAHTYLEKNTSFGKVLIDIQD